MESYYPPVSFQFIVEFEGFPGGSDCGFQEVSGLSVNIQTEDYAEGGENRFVHKLPKGSSYETLVLKRGILKDSRLADWFRKATETLEFEPKNLTVSLLNEEQSKLCTWNIVHACPSKWSGAALNAESSALFIETMELNYHYFTFEYH